LRDRVLIRRVEAKEKTPGGIIIPDTAKEKPIKGEVLAVGAGAPDETGRIIPLAVKAGDRVLFGKWAGTEVLIEGEERLILKEADIFGVIEGKMWAASMRRLYDLANLIDIKRAIEIAGNGAVVRTRAARRSTVND
jgi:chaperonin GroES